MRRFWLFFLVVITAWAGNNPVNVGITSSKTKSAGIGITLDGGVLSCVIADAGNSGCVSADGTFQTMGIGDKQFTGNVGVDGGVYSYDVFFAHRFYVPFTGLPMFLSSVTGNSGYPDFVWDTLNERTTSNVIYDFRTGGHSGMSLSIRQDLDGQLLGLGLPHTYEFGTNGLISAVGTSQVGAFQCGQNGSGSLCLECTDPGTGCYVPIRGHIFNGSNHGVLHVQNAVYLDGGLMLQVRNPGLNGNDPSNGTDAFDINYNGGFGQPLRGENRSQFPPCPDPNHFNNEFGAGDVDSLLEWAADERRYYVCNTSTRTDGGSLGYVPVVSALSWSYTIDFGSVTNGCTDATPVIVEQANVGDQCVVGTGAAPPSGSHFSCYVNATNFVTVRHCAFGTVDPPSTTFTVRAFRP